MGENPKKYHVTDDGDVYRINEDGSFTSMGNAENMSDPSQNKAPASSTAGNSENDKPIKPFAKKKHRGLVLGGLCMLLILLGGISLFFVLHTPNSTNFTKEGTHSVDTVFKSNTDEHFTEIEHPILPEEPVESKETSQEHITKEESFQPAKNKEIETPQASETSVKSSNKVSDKIRQEVIDPNKIYSAVEIQADFPGGDRARRQWLRDNIQWPRDADGRQLQGEVELEFVIERDGSISNVKVLHSENSELNSAAIRLISSMPKWIPAMVKNQPVRSPMGITLFF